MASSKFAIPIRLAGALACIVMGMMVIIATVLLYSRHRYVMHGHPVREQLKMAFMFVILMGTGLPVCVTTIELLKQTTLTARAGCDQTPPSTQLTHQGGDKGSSG